MIRSPAFAGSVSARIIGFGADVSIKVSEENCLQIPCPCPQLAQKNILAIHQCVSRFDEFQLHLGGSLAADLSIKRHIVIKNVCIPTVHWFHRPLAQAMQSHVEEVDGNKIYCFDPIFLDILSTYW